MLILTVNFRRPALGTNFKTPYDAFHQDEQFYTIFVIETFVYNRKKLKNILITQPRLEV